MLLELFIFKNNNLHTGINSFLQKFNAIRKEDLRSPPPWLISLSQSLIHEASPTEKEWSVSQYFQLKGVILDSKTSVFWDQALAVKISRKKKGKLRLRGGGSRPQCVRWLYVSDLFMQLIGNILCEPLWTKLRRMASVI